MTNKLDKIKIGVVGAGTMGTGIAQAAATAGHTVVLADSNGETVINASKSHDRILNRLVEKGRVSESESKNILRRISYDLKVDNFKDCDFVIEAIIEDLDVKKKLFSNLETLVSYDCILATNTSSLSVSSIASSCQIPERVIGVHFFNPAPIMPLVEIIPTMLTNSEVLETTKNLIDNFGKTTVIANDLPGFIVNRVARPFYGESLRILEEGIADVPTIDWAMKELGGFKMGPFELMDLIGNDINYAVTETVFKQFYHDPRYKPSIIQKRLVESGKLGKKSKMGFYDYSDNASNSEPNKDKSAGMSILERVLYMLINEAAEAVYWGAASREDVETAMTKGVNYPKGLLQWGEEIGYEKVFDGIKKLHDVYCDDRYRPSLWFKNH